MKRPSLCPHLRAATLFLGSGLRGEQAKADGPPVARETEGDDAKRRRTEAVANEVAKRRAVREAAAKAKQAGERNKAFCFPPWPGKRTLPPCP
jgi:hypothetical protein